MRVFNDLNNLPKFKNAVITIGSFDGVHHGHQQILEKVKTLAQKKGGESIVITFHPHPRLVIYPQDDTLKLISTIDEKVDLLRRYGIDNVVVVPFTFEFSRQTADEYILNFLVDKFHPKQIVIGYDHRFGLNRQGDINYLKWHGQKADFQVIEIEKQEISDIAVSSTKVRQSLEKGAVSQAAELLNHYYSLTGTVVRGQQIGHKIGFPTANLQINSKHKLIPPDGIYAVFVWHKKMRLEGMLYIGSRPTLEEFDNRTIEVNIFDFDKNIYGDKLKLELVAFTRDDQKYDNLEDLKMQLAEDKRDSIKILTEEKAKEIKLEDSLPSVAVVILNYNTKTQLEEFLPTVLKTDYPNLKIVVADNGSKDESIKLLKEKFPQIECLDLVENHGFAKGYNLALENIDAEYFVLLNSDVEVTKNWIRPVISLMEKDATIGAAQPKILAHHQKNKFEHAGAAGGFIDYLGYPFCRGRIISSVEEDQNQYDFDREVFWASGAAFFVRSKLFKNLEGFDSDYFAHMEEIDFCWRLKRAGYRIISASRSTVYHVGGGTLNYESPFKTYLNFRNNLFTILKNEPRKKLFWLIPLRLVLDGLAGGLFLTQGKFAHIKAIINAHFAFYKSFSKMRNKRSVVQNLIEKVSIQQTPNKTGIFKESILVNYYLKGKRKFSDLKF